MPELIDDANSLLPGDIYEDGFFHPCVCVGVKGGLAWGISLIDGSYPRSTDIFVGGVRRLTIEEAWEWAARAAMQGHLSSSIGMIRYAEPDEIIIFNGRLDPAGLSAAIPIVTLAAASDGYHLRLNPSCKLTLGAIELQAFPSSLRAYKSTASPHRLYHRIATSGPHCNPAAPLRETDGYPARTAEEILESPEVRSHADVGCGRRVRWTFAAADRTDRKRGRRSDLVFHRQTQCRCRPPGTESPSDSRFQLERPRPIRQCARRIEHFPRPRGNRPPLESVHSRMVRRQGRPEIGATALRP